MKIHNRISQIKYGESGEGGGSSKNCDGAVVEEKKEENKGGWSESKEVKYEKVVYEEKEGVDGSPNVRL